MKIGKNLKAMLNQDLLYMTASSPVHANLRNKVFWYATSALPLSEFDWVKITNPAKMLGDCIPSKNNKSRLQTLGRCEQELSQQKL